MKNMKQKTKITSLRELIDWICNNSDCTVFGIEEDNFTVEAPNNATWQIQFKTDDDIDAIISKTICQLEEFDADNEFTELWNVDFANHNHFKPSQFIKMLQEDEATFKELAGELADVWYEENINFLKNKDYEINEKIKRKDI